VLVVVDARHLGLRRGIARTTREMVRELASVFPEDEWRLVAPGSEPVEVPQAPNVTLARPRLPSRVVYGAAAVAREPTLARLAGSQPDVVWLPHPVPVAVGRAPYVLTIHDLSWEERPADFTRYERFWHRAARPRSLARGAAEVTAVSAATSAAAVARWGLDPDRITVIRSGVRVPDRAAQPPRRPLPDRYLLFVGGLEPRKDPELLVEAHARARARGLDAELVFVGDGPLTPRLEGRPGVHLLGVVEDDELDALYRGAIALVLPSRLEGYGFPPLEALARGTPAIVADLDVYDETVGAGALRFASGDPEALAGALERVEAERERLLAAAPPTPSWRDAATAMRSVLARAAGR